MIPRFTALAVALALAVLAVSAAQADGSKFDSTVRSILTLPYQAEYVPSGNDTAFENARNTAPAEDYTSGSVAGDPDFPGWPAWFKQVLFRSADGAPLYGQLALHAGKHPGVVVVHGFNTNGYDSVIRWAAMLYANGYNVLAADQRDFKYEYRDPNKYGYPNWLQTFGWKESQDVIAAGKYLHAQPGVGSVGVVGFSEGAQNTVLALAQDSQRLFSAGLTFSAPADQSTQIYSTASPPGCTPPLCTYPATSALIVLVVPPSTYTDPCDVLADAGALYKTTPSNILLHESAFSAQDKVQVPLLNFYAQDDPLVQDFQATMMAAYNQGHANQRTIEITKGAHAYYYDRWWQQRAILLYFKALLPKAQDDKTITTNATVNQTAGGTPLSTQLVDLGSPTRDEADRLAAPLIC
jgi:predicted alpha/beta-fold hydrolase